jgi:hypothetical protein
MIAIPLPHLGIAHPLIVADRLKICMILIIEMEKISLIVSRKTLLVVTMVKGAGMTMLRLFTKNTVIASIITALKMR